MYTRTPRSPYCIIYETPKPSLLLILHAASGIEGVDVIAADVADQDSLENMCAKATVVINCVGPVSL